MGRRVVTSSSTDLIGTRNKKGCDGGKRKHCEIIDSSSVYDLTVQQKLIILFHHISTIKLTIKVKSCHHLLMLNPFLWLSLQRKKIHVKHYIISMICLIVM